METNACGQGRPLLTNLGKHIAPVGSLLACALAFRLGFLRGCAGASSAAMAQNLGREDRNWLPLRKERERDQGPGQCVEWVYACRKDVEWGIEQ